MADSSIIESDWSERAVDGVLFLSFPFSKSSSALEGQEVKAAAEEADENWGH